VRAWEAEVQKGSKPSKPQQPKAPLSFTNDELTEFPDIPANWVWLRLGANSVSVFDGPFGSNLKSSDYVAKGVRVVRLENIGEREFVEDKYSFITEEKYQLLEKHTVYPGDLVFSSFITERTRVALIPASIERAVNKADCFCVRCNGESANSTFLCFYLSTHFIYKQLENQIHGVGRPRINTTQLKEAPYPLCSIAEQAEILHRIDKQSVLLDNLERSIETELQKAEALRQSILKKAFSGQLVAQDPTDEPASVLLERIRAGREAVASAPKAKKKPAHSRA
jgi:type I restriction enzyme, S subunit